MSKRKQEAVLGEQEDVMPAHKKKKERSSKTKKLDLSIYEAAANSLNGNKHIENMVLLDEFYRDRMKQIQATYKMRQNHKHNFEIQVIWDHDRLWGSFDLEFFKGVFLVDPGPNQYHFTAEDRAYSLVWRGVNKKIPGIPYYSTSNIGCIRFGFNEIWGRLESMLGDGFIRSPCEFHGKRPLGPAAVTLSIEDIIKEWNTYGIGCKNEAPRLFIPNIDNVIRRSITTTSGKVHEEFLKSFTGIFDVTSEVVERKCPDKAQDLMVRFHLDPKEAVWGQFDVGIVDGYILLNLPTVGSTHRSSMEFQWRGRETETGRPTAGSGEVVIWEDKTIRGTFHGMAGDVDFRGKRKAIPIASSGRGISYYRLGWQHYANGGDF